MQKQLSYDEMMRLAYEGGYLPTTVNPMGYSPQAAQVATPPATVPVTPTLPTQATPQPTDPSMGLNAEQMRHQLSQMVAPSLQGPPPEPTADDSSSYAPPSAAALATDDIVGAKQNAAAAEGGMAQNIARQESGITQEGAAEQKLGRIAAQKGQDQAEIDAEAVELGRQQEEQTARIAKQGEMAAQAQMSRVMAAADDAAQANVHDFWEDRTSGARVLGVIAQTLAGAANSLAGNPSAPTPLDRIIQRDLETQLANLNQKNRNVESQRGVLRDIYESTGNRMQATSAMYVAAWKRIGLMSDQLNSKYATSTSEANNQKIQGLVQQRIASATDATYAKIHNDAVAQMQHGENVLAETERTAAMSAPKEATGENAKVYRLAGMKAPVDASMYKQFKEEDQNYRQFIKQAEHVDWLFKHGSGDKGNDWQDYNAARSSMFATLRQMQKTGAALSDAELANAEQMLPSLVKGEVPGVAWLTNARQMMGRIMTTASRGHFGMLDGSIEGVELDPTDVRYGEHVSNYMREQVQERAQRNAGN